MILFKNKTNLIVYGFRNDTFYVYTFIWLAIFRYHIYINVFKISYEIHNISCRKKLSFSLFAPLLDCLNIWRLDIHWNIILVSHYCVTWESSESRSETGVRKHIASYVETRGKGWVETGWSKQSSTKNKHLNDCKRKIWWCVLLLSVRKSGIREL